MHIWYEKDKLIRKYLNVFEDSFILWRQSSCSYRFLAVWRLKFNAIFDFSALFGAGAQSCYWLIIPITLAYSHNVFVRIIDHLLTNGVARYGCRTRFSQSKKKKKKSENPGTVHDCPTIPCSMLQVVFTSVEVAKKAELENSNLDKRLKVWNPSEMSYLFDDIWAKTSCSETIMEHFLSLDVCNLYSN